MGVASMAQIGITVNGTPHRHDVEPRLLLVHYLRDVLGLTGTHVGCDTSQCGACTVLIDGRAAKSCTLLAAQVHGSDVITVEGLSGPDGRLHPVQEAFREHHALQCGFCTPGMLMAAIDVIERTGLPSEEQIRHGLNGNLCRCTGYEFIVDAVADASRRVADAREPAR